MIRGKTKKELAATLPQHCFWVNNGPILSDLQELYAALKNEITSEQFSHHVNGHKNDFADWIERTLGDPLCAKKMRSAKKQDTATSRIKDCLKGYNI